MERFEFEELVVPLFDEAWEKRREGDEFAPSLGKVPILWDGETVIWDSLAIIGYCADKVGRERFWPEEEAARGGRAINRIGSVRIAAIVPLSAQWASSIEIRSGDTSKAPRSLGGIGTALGRRQPKMCDLVQDHIGLGVAVKR